MQLPAELRDRIRELSAGMPESELRRASARLTEAYRGVGAPALLATPAERLAYATVRMPSTYAAVREALTETAASMEGFAPKTMLDLGSGPGTAMWAARGVFPSLLEMECIERDRGMRNLAAELASAGGLAVSTATWTGQDLREWHPEKKYDVIVASYSFGELNNADRTSLLVRAWEACAGALVVVEPGTRNGFENVLEARRALIDFGANLPAPCPGRMECPMKAAGDWCHFSVRVERTAEHRRLKQGELGYEDEKFSYVAGSRPEVRATDARVVRHPMRHSGFTKLQLCTPEGLQERTITRSQKEAYRRAKRAEWGSRWEE